jgi:transglutaminase-like putative cysteine protease
LLAAVATLLTATGLIRVFDGFFWWYLPCAGGVLVVVVCGWLGRVGRVPVALQPLVYLAGLALYVPAVSAPQTRRLLLPTPSTWRALRELASIGAEDVRRLAVPVPNRPGLVLLVVLGTFAVACAVDIISTLFRSPATAGLPLLALLAVPAAIVPGDVGLFPFLCAAIGYLILLGSHRMPGHEGRFATSSAASVASADPDGAGRGLGTLRIAVFGLLAALLVPAILPGPGRGLLAPRSSGGLGGLGDAGTGRARVVQPFVTLNQQLRSDEIVPLLQVRTDTPEYLRLTALENFDGSRFSLGRLQADPSARVNKGGLPPPGPVRAATATGSVKVRDEYRQRYLPVPQGTTAIDIAGDWRLHAPTSTVFSGRTDTGGMRYSYAAQVPAPTASALRTEPPPSVLPPEIGVDLRLPGIDPDVRRLARSLTASQPTVYDKVAAIQQYLRGPLFTYDLNGAPTNSRDALRTFLLDTRRGYCEQFASAMAVLVRSIGVPARVAIGFTPGTRDDSGDWIITNRDAHAWPEVWFPQSGWVRFEPTPRDDSAEVTPDYSIPPITGAADSGPGEANDRPDAAAQSNDRPAPLKDSGDLSTPATDGSAGASRRAWTTAGIGSGLGTVLVLGLLSPLLVRTLRRRRRLGGRPGGPSDAWREVLDTAKDLGLGTTRTESPRAAARRWHSHLTKTDEDGRAGAALIRLSRAEERARFAGPAFGTAPGTDTSAEHGAAVDASAEHASSEHARAGEDAELVVRALENSSRRRDRIRARILPRSVLEAAALRVGAWRERLAGLARRLRRPRHRAV